MSGFVALALALAAPARVDAVAARYGLAGEVLVARGNAVLLDHGYGAIAPAGRKRHRAGSRWRLASITKQIVATTLVRDAYAGGVPLDAPLGQLLDPRLGAATTRQLLTHHSGLANPDDTLAGADGVPAFYKATAPDTAFCLGKEAEPGSAFSYNNCDYLIAGMLLGRSGRPEPWPAGIRMATGGAQLVPGFVGGRPEPVFSLASFGAAGALTGTARDLFRFDRELMNGRLMSPAAREALWRSDPAQGYQAIGQWVFPGKLAGCAAAKRIVQRDGEIFGVQTRNYILPNDDLVVIVFTNRGADDFAIGEVWQQKGFAYDLLSAAACP